MTHDYLRHSTEESAHARREIGLMMAGSRHDA